MRTACVPKENLYRQRTSRIPVSGIAATSVLALGLAGMGILLWPSTASALDHCTARIRATDGTILVGARNVSGTLTWGNTAGTETNATGNACVTGSTARGCTLGTGAVAITPPPLCTLYLKDDVGACSAFIRQCTPGERTARRGVFDVKDFGAVGDGSTLDDGAITAAIDALPPQGGIVYFPPGVYLTGGITNLVCGGGPNAGKLCVHGSIDCPSGTCAEKKFTLEGAGGSCGHPAPDGTQGPPHCATIVKSVTPDVPIVTFTATPAEVGSPHLLPSELWVALRNLAIQGNGCGNPNLTEMAKCTNLGNVGTVNGQHCLQVDNGSLEAYDITLLHCGGHGLFITNGGLGASKFYNLAIAWANGNGIHTDISGGAVPASHTNTNFFGGKANANGGDGIHLTKGDSGISTFGFDVESNHGYGIKLEGTGDVSGGVTHCRFMSIWDEVNGAGSVYFGENAAHNLVDYIRYSSGEPVDVSGRNGNLVWGSDTYAVPSGCSGEECAIARIKHQMNVIKTTRVTSSENEQLTIRDSTDTIDGDVHGGNLSASNFVNVASRIQLFHGICRWNNPLNILPGVLGTCVSGNVGAGCIIDSDCGTGNELVLWDTDRLNVGTPVANIEADGARTLQLNSSEIMLGTNQTERLRIDSTGNVGIGTTMPQAKLQVAGDVAVQTAGSGLILRSPDGSSCYRITVDNAGTLATSPVSCP